MRNSDIPCPPPKGYANAPWDPKYDNGIPTNEAYEPFPPKGHNEGAFEEFVNSVWGVPHGRRGGE